MAGVFWVIVAIVLFFTVGTAIIGFGLHLLGLFLLGLVWGALGRLLVRDTQGMGIAATALAGLAGSLVAGIVADRADLSTPLELALSLVFAAVAVFLVRGIAGSDRPGGERR